MSLDEWKMMQYKKKDLKNTNKWTIFFHPKESPAEDEGKERAVEALNFRSLRFYWNRNCVELNGRITSGRSGDGSTTHPGEHKSSILRKLQN